MSKASPAELWVDLTSRYLYARVGHQTQVLTAAVIIHGQHAELA